MLFQTGGKSGSPRQTSKEGAMGFCFFLDSATKSCCFSERFLFWIGKKRATNCVFQVQLTGGRKDSWRRYETFVTACWIGTYLEMDGNGHRNGGTFPVSYMMCLAGLTFNHLGVVQTNVRYFREKTNQPHPFRSRNHPPISTSHTLNAFTRWWFQTFFIFTFTWGNDPIWL